MVSNSFLKSLLVLKDAQARAFSYHDKDLLTVIFKAGYRFDAVTIHEEIEDYTFFHDLASNLVYVAPTDCVFLLSGRFGSN